MTSANHLDTMLVVFVMEKYPALGKASPCQGLRDYILALHGAGLRVCILQETALLPKDTAPVPENDKAILTSINLNNIDLSSERIENVVFVIDGYEIRSTSLSLIKESAESSLRKSLPSQFAFKWVARVVFETTVPQKYILEAQKYFDEIWVPAKFHKDAFASRTCPSCHVAVIGEAIDTDLFQASSQNQENCFNAERPFRFLALSQYPFPTRSQAPGWNQVRKAIPLLLKVFSETFSPDDPVTLTLKGSGNDPAQLDAIGAYLETIGRGEFLQKVEFIGKFIPSEDLPEFYSGFDAFIGVNRGEGWGRPLAEAMAMGMPTLASKFGGNLEFMTVENSYLVDCGQIPVSQFFPGLAHLGHIGSPNLDSYRENLLMVYKNNADRLRKAEEARKTIQSNFGRPAIAQRIINRLGCLFPQKTPN